MAYSHRSHLWFAWPALLGMIPLHLPAQSSSVVNSGGLNSAIVTPTVTSVLGQQDSAALKELAAHLAAVGSVPWTGMQGTGQLVYGGKDSTAYPATLSMLGSDRFRLDAKTGKGEMSLRIHGHVGKTQDNGGPIFVIPSETAEAGIFPFGLVRLDHSPGRQISLLDRGVVAEDGAELHRITVELGSIGRDPVTKSRRTVAIDFYFDAATHLLSKSASSGFIEAGHSAKFLRVVTYSDYRKVGGSMVPFRYAECMDGEPYWVLQLSDVQLNPALDATYFQF